MIAHESTLGGDEETGLKDGRRSLPAVVILNVLAVGFYLLIALRMGFFGHMEATLFSSPDSHVYRDVAKWLFGSAPNPFESQRRAVSLSAAARRGRPHGR